ncbi:20144_t:CDS:2 [Entrophospora sp. SA101]|nr:20144_t:CDS:2 [Entrophospora sp. SA101]
MVHRRRSITAHNHRSQARNNINSHINRLNSSQYVYRFLQGNNPNSLIYVERTWGNYPNEIVRYLCHYHHHHQ